MAHPIIYLECIKEIKKGHEVLWAYGMNVREDWQPVYYIQSCFIGIRMIRIVKLLVECWGELSCRSKIVTCETIKYFSNKTRLVTK